MGIQTIPNFGNSTIILTKTLKIKKIDLPPTSFTIQNYFRYILFLKQKLFVIINTNAAKAFEKPLMQTIS